MEIVIANDELEILDATKIQLIVLQQRFVPQKLS